LLGKKYGKQLPAINAALQAADAGAIERNVSAGQSVTLSVDGQPLELLPDEVLVETKQKEGFAVMEDEGLVVALDTNLTPVLKLEGLARDLVRYVQDMRKAAKFNIADRIRLYVSGNGPTTQLLDSNLAVYIANETLAREVQRLPDRAALPATAYTQEVELDGTPVLLGIEQTGEQAGDVRMAVDEE
jgi:isoleucyl-tRNA synthetase